MVCAGNRVQCYNVPHTNHKLPIHCPTECFKVKSYWSWAHHCERYVSFRCATVAMPILVDAEADGQVARPGPEGGGVGERHIQIVAMQGQVGRPDRLQADITTFILC